jgi:hypothetical protein
MVWQHTILQEDIQTLLDEEIGVQDNKSEGKRKNVITCANFQELSDGFL